ncbi:hypothetical protein GCM10009814_22850 [Lapillicoccus jejuensis]
MKHSLPTAGVTGVNRVCRDPLAPNFTNRSRRGVRHLKVELHRWDTLTTPGKLKSRKVASLRAVLKMSLTMQSGVDLPRTPSNSGTRTNPTQRTAPISAAGADVRGSKAPSQQSAKAT